MKRTLIAGALALVSFAAFAEPMCADIKEVDAAAVNEGFRRSFSAVHGTSYVLVYLRPDKRWSLWSVQPDSGKACRIGIGSDWTAAYKKPGQDS